MAGKDQQFLLDHISYKGNQSLIQLHILMFYDSSDPCLRLQSQGDNSMCINSVQISLRAIAPCRTYRLSDTLKTAQMSCVVIVLQQLTHGWSQRVAPIHVLKATHLHVPRTSLHHGLALWFGKLKTPPSVRGGNFSHDSNWFSCTLFKACHNRCFSDIFTLPKTYWLHVQF